MMVNKMAVADLETASSFEIASKSTRILHCKSYYLILPLPHKVLIVASKCLVVTSGKLLTPLFYKLGFPLMVFIHIRT